MPPLPGSLSTNKLRANLLGLLSTNLSKEAEVELRAYWERMNSRVPAEDDNHSFHLLQAFEVHFISLSFILLDISFHH